MTSQLPFVLVTLLSTLLSPASSSVFMIDDAAMPYVLGLRSDRSHSVPSCFLNRARYGRLVWECVDDVVPASLVAVGKSVRMSGLDTAG
ncbi:MAG TPA: hypothetical protein VK436_16030 [Methanocella sp.]|nr:hypothetical protein [Methanocella sp.]